jgi:hypothetical protein
MIFQIAPILLFLVAPIANGNASKYNLPFDGIVTSSTNEKADEHYHYFVQSSHVKSERYASIMFGISSLVSLVIKTAPISIAAATKLPDKKWYDIRHYFP